MAGRLEPLEVEPPEVASEAEGQTKSSKKTEDLLEMVKKLQKEGSLEPQIEDLINRINELQQEALRTLQLHCQRTERESQRLHVEEQLEDLIGQHKDLWEFHMLKQRLAWEISALQGSLEQLLTEERLARARLQEVEQRLRSPPEVEGAAPAENGRRKEELEELGGQVPAQTQSTPEGGAGKGEAGPQLPGARGKDDLAPPVELALTPP
ncbi:synaptonemal complex central element protein 1-like isoform X13 [Camelus dromedarius]|uniref:synaptonemal complex central element protein 1-like isoform X13 n=1 Tax=Camelus dromedarius TaxID=9838 RepID=UPI003119387A